MEIFFTLVIKIIPLYCIIFLGFIAGKYLHVQRESIAKLLIYIISPVVIFNSILATPLTVGVLLLPVMFYLVSSCICLVTLFFSKHWWQDSTKNIVSFAAGSGNTGYFGLPVAIALLGPDVAGLALIATLGIILYENTVGFFITARGHHTIQESIQRVLKLPTIYGFIIGITINFLGFKLGPAYFDFANLFRGAYTVLGMMLIGLGLASITSYKFDFKFISVTLVTKFIVWPVLILGIIMLDMSVLHFFNSTIYSVMKLLAIVPLAANTVAFATELKTHPEKAAFAVLLSTLVALLYIPLMASLFF